MSIKAQEKLEFSRNKRQVLGLPKEKSASVSVGDIDNDGDLDMDLILTNRYGQQNFVYLNDAFADIDATEKCFWELKRRDVI